MPVRVEVDADTETPVSAFLKLSRGEEHAFLLESVEGGERSARFSFLGAGPRSALRWKLGDGGDPIAANPFPASLDAGQTGRMQECRASAPGYLPAFQSRNASPARYPSSAWYSWFFL